MRLRRFTLAGLAALGIVLGWGGLAATPVLAQAVPRAAPTSPAPAEGQPLAAPTGSVDVVQTGGTAEPAVPGISAVSLFLRADPIVKTVIVLLLLASLWSWAIIINKWLALGVVRRRAGRFEKTFWSGQSLDELYQQFASRADHPLAAVFVSALREWRRAFENGPPRESLLDSIKDRVDKAMSVTILRETDGMERQLGFLATIGATAPFVGLFGTVWGIMNSFSAIAARHDTTLAVVAPGIAEALFTTAMGLLAAIPAVIFYNKFVGDISRYSSRVEAFADEFSAILSRQLDEKAR
ncbi:MAG: protein TolQ [Alphaproteobacteria bacterium]|nr:protein TolQ [Alphaproteobacteria bacterium]MDE2014147.1 protein TolQ [Alphaproteobacteria bacterium]MDE2073708.1 protein TolQ [Alphaproteobacteria bacterium]MDE2352521.1 protein TolQ [Alphaproteobacteria bacterium]